MKGPALMTGLGLQRSQWLNQEKANGATMETVKIKDVDVSFLSTPDNQIRSYLVKDGDFVLVTTSRTMAERFLETGKGERALASSEEFRFARSLMPLNEMTPSLCTFRAAFSGAFEPAVSNRNAAADAVGHRYGSADDGTPSRQGRGNLCQEYGRIGCSGNAAQGVWKETRWKRAA
ncbi:MAG: hypothetical protein U0894_02030 [Pirellulales bacterium]